MRATSLVDPRVVLHGAGTQRIHAVIDGVVPGGKAREMADGFHLADFREAVDFGADVLRRPALRRRPPRARRAREAGRPACRASCARTAAARSARGADVTLSISFLALTAAPPPPHPYPRGATFRWRRAAPNRPARDRSAPSGRPPMIFFFEQRFDSSPPGSPTRAPRIR